MAGFSGPKALLMLMMRAVVFAVGTLLTNLTSDLWIFERGCWAERCSPRAPREKRRSDEAGSAGVRPIAKLGLLACNAGRCIARFKVFAATAGISLRGRLGAWLAGGRWVVRGGKKGLGMHWA